MSGSESGINIVNLSGGKEYEKNNKMKSGVKT